MNIENEVEAPRNDAFGLAAVHAQRRRERLERRYHKGFVWTLCGLAGIGLWLFTYHAFAAKWEQTISLDHHEKCVVITFKEGEKVRHRNTHCPALTKDGTLGWPLGRE